MGLPLKKFVCERIWKFIHEEVTKKIYFINNVFKNSSTFASPQVKILQLFQLSLKSFEDCDDENFIPIPSPNPPTNWTVISRDAHPQGKGVQKNWNVSPINRSINHIFISIFQILEQHFC